jgi:hypothetical protein
MYTPLPEEYIEQQFRVYAGYARCKPSGVFEGGCPVCREGKSWGHKRRLFYIPDHGSIHCKNCHRSWSPPQWIMEVSGKSYHEVMEESKEYEYVPVELLEKRNNFVKPIDDPLPMDAINLSDRQQLEFYKRNTVVRECITFMIKRRLNKAVNRPKDFYISLVDRIHKNRLVIPFVDDTGKIEFYQTRSFLKNTDDNLPKYLGRSGAEKTLFGADRISEDIDYIFIFEGPIDSTFVLNGVAAASIDLTNLQRDKLNEYPFHKKIWVLDNQHIDKTAREATKKLLEAGETVFIWKKGLEKFKDFNDICVYKKINEIPTKYIVDNSFTGIQGLFQMKQLGL